MTADGKVIYALIACHNRRELTLRSIRALNDAASATQVRTEVVLFDDGSSDGTAEAVAERFPQTHILSGDGSAYWARSMATAEAYVLEKLAPSGDDFLLWLNDDVVLQVDALETLLRTSDSFPGSVIVGAVCDPVRGVMTYSGFRRYGRHALHLAKVVPTSSPVLVDSFNGNVVLVPIAVAKFLGGIDGTYSHAWADLDYGFRCQKTQTRAVLAPGYMGTCPGNQPVGQKPIGVEWKAFLSPKGAGHFRSLLKILKSQSKVLWLPQLAATYALWWYRTISRRLRQDRWPLG